MLALPCACRRRGLNRCGKLRPRWRRSSESRIIRKAARQCAQTDACVFEPGDLIAEGRRDVLQFAAIIRIRGINPYVDVSARRAAQLRRNWRRPLPVLVRINGKPMRRPWRINMMLTGKGSFYLYLHNSVRRAAGTEVGDRVNVELGFDSKYKSGPMHPMPRWFRTALARAPQAKLNWSQLTLSRRKEILRYFASLKSEASRQRNLTRALAALSGASMRFMARSWSAGK